MTDETARPLVDNDTVHAFLDGDGADPEAFETLRRRITLAVPYVLDSEVGRAYAVAKLAEAEKRGAAKALARINDDLLNYRDRLREKRGSHTRWALGVEEAAREVRTLAARIESGEVTL